MSPSTRRREIVRAAERLIGRYGPSKTTIADVAREADISVGSVYLEFPSKDALIEELSASRYKAVMAAMRAEAELDSMPYRDRLRGILDARAGELDAPKPEATADTILSAYISFSPPWIFAFEKDELLGRLRAMHDLVLYGLVRRQPLEKARS